MKLESGKKYVYNFFKTLYGDTREPTDNTDNLYSEDNNLKNDSKNTVNGLGFCKLH